MLALMSGVIQRRLRPWNRQIFRVVVQWSPTVITGRTFVDMVMAESRNHWCVGHNFFMVHGLFQPIRPSLRLHGDRLEWRFSVNQLECSNRQSDNWSAWSDSSSTIGSMGWSRSILEADSVHTAKFINSILRLSDDIAHILTTRNILVSHYPRYELLR